MTDHRQPTATAHSGSPGGLSAPGSTPRGFAALRAKRAAQPMTPAQRSEQTPAQANQPGSHGPRVSFKYLARCISQADLDSLRKAVVARDSLFAESNGIVPVEGKNRFTEAAPSKFGKINLLHLAVKSAPSVLEFLLGTELASWIDRPNNIGNTPLHLAMVMRNWTAVELLINRNANPNVICADTGMAPIHTLVTSTVDAPAGMLTAFLEHGADLSLWTRKKESTRNKTKLEGAGSLVVSHGPPNQLFAPSPVVVQVNEVPSKEFTPIWVLKKVPEKKHLLAELSAFEARKIMRGIHSREVKGQIKALPD